MENILKQILLARQQRLSETKKNVSLIDIRRRAESCPPPALPFLEAITKARSRGIHIIAEVKQASPSKGLLTSDFRPLDIASSYLEGGASAISVLTEVDHFLGKDEYLKQISHSIPLPTLRKDFIIDEYQIFEAKVLGASAFLLIVDCIEKKHLRDLSLLGAQLGLCALIEVHNERQLETAIEIDAKIIGINNRDLTNFETKLDTCLQLRKKIPASIPVVGESGIQTREDLQLLAQNGIQAALIGESLIREKNPAKKLEALLDFDA